ncbi:MAG: Fic family protein, partial [Hyphomonadaceae bacterium]|nr:Fic family protein [Hyphomonadaceae bacterium]
MTPLRSDWLADIVPLKAELDALRPLSQDALAQLQAHFDVELTWSSNAIEGNTLTLRETAEVIAHGITVGGKPLRDHLEAQDHHAALLWMRDLAAHDSLIGERTITELHRRIVLRSNPAIAGLYSPFPRRIAGSAAVFPNPAKVPYLMAELGAWLTGETPSLETALEAHWRLVAVHPFSDGNGRCARLLMNLILLRAGYPPVAVRPEDRAV